MNPKQMAGNSEMPARGRGRLRVIASVLAACVLGAGALGAAAAAAEPQQVTVDRIVAVVNDQIILLSELAQASLPFEERAAAEAPDAIGKALARKQVREKILNDMIGDRLVEEQAKEVGLTVSDREIDDEIGRIKKENNLDDAQLAAQMRQQGLDEHGLREMLRKQKLRQKIIEVRVNPRVVITDAEVRSYYDENYKNDDQIHVFMISKRIPQAASDAERDAVKESLEKIRSEVTTGGRDFAALAKTETQGPNAENGGDIGWFKRGEIAPEIEQVAFSLKDGEVSNVVEYGGAFHLILVKERKQAPPKSFDEVKDKIRGVLFGREGEKEYQRWVEELRAKSFVEVRLDGPVVADDAPPTPRPVATPKKKT